MKKYIHIINEKIYRVFSLFDSKIRRRDILTCRSKIQAYTIYRRN